MTSWGLVLRSLRFHARSHLGAFLGAIVSSAVLIGALAVGDSVRASLRNMALARLGAVHFAVPPGDRFFRSALAADLAAEARVPAASGMLLPGSASTGDNSARANQIQVVGVEAGFWKLAAGSADQAVPAPEEVHLNQPLAAQLRVKVGDSIVLRIPQPSQLSRDAPISPQEDSTAALRVKVAAILNDQQAGRFSLQANQVPPSTAFISLSWLQQRLKLPARANLLLAGGSEATTAEAVNTALSKVWRLADAELEARVLTNSPGLELRTSRVFLDGPVAEAALKAGSNGLGVFTYFVNELKARQRTTPYSMVASLAPPLLPPGMKDDEILLSQWEADDLQARPGDDVELTYFVVGNMRRLEEKTTKFRVRAVYPMNSPLADRALMPDFPGMTDAQNCRDWDTGLPIKTDRIRDRDEKYWTDYRGTPKACVTLAAGQKMWENRFGNLTAVRYGGATELKSVEAGIRRNLDPASVGLRFEPIRAQALLASAQSQDFGGLFIGFSFFLIGSALLLMALLFQFAIEQRSREVGTLLAVGFTPKRVRRMFLLEGGAICAAGSLVGIVAGMAYAKVMLHGLSTIWRSAVNTSSLEFHANPGVMVGGAVGGMLIAWGAIWLALRRQARQPARALLADGGLEALAEAEGSTKGSKWNRWTASLCLLGAGALLASELAKKGAANPEMFFSAGSLLLIGLLALVGVCLDGLAAAGAREAAGSVKVPTLSGLGLRNATRRRKRSVATVSLLACGSFLIASIGVFRLDSNKDATQRKSGTGGFALIGSAAAPITQDLNSRAGRDTYGLDEKAMANVSLVPFRLKDGDEASCLNLNRAQKPRLLGVQPELLGQRKAFSFAGVAKGLDAADPWMLLRAKQPDGAVPAIGDAASIQWALGKSLGDTLDYTDDRGRAFKLRLVAGVANSILQGSLIIAEDEFIARFPNESGYRMFLIDAPSNEGERVSGVLTRALKDAGFEAVSAPLRLDAFNAVQNTYLSTFQVLGGLGLLLGSAGLGVVVLRNVLERRGELALLLAVGFRPGSVRWMILVEHGALLLAGLAVGVLSALAAVLPALLAPGAEAAGGSLGWTLAAVLASGLVWTTLATWVAMRGTALDALRNN